MRLIPALAVAITLSGPALLRAQATPQRFATNEWIIDRWSSDQGLPQNTVSDIVQDNDGYMWIATYGGLVRFDGVRFTRFSTRDYPGLGSDRVMVLRMAADGSLWIGTDRGLVRFKDGQFREWTEADGRPRGQSTGLAPTPDGSVWVSATIGGVGLLRNGRFERFTDRGVRDGYVESVTVDRAGVVWLNLGGANFEVRPPGAQAFRPIVVKPPGLSIWRLTGLDSHGDAAFDTDKGVYLWTGNGLAATGAVGGNLKDDGQGGYWTIGDHALVHTDSARRVEQIPLSADAYGGPVKSFFVDRDGTPWLGSETMGLLRFRRRVFHTYLSREGLTDEAVAAVFRDRSGRLLVGTSCAPTYAIIGARAEKRPELPGCAFSFSQLPDGTLAVGGYGGISLVAPNGRITRWPADSIHSGEALVAFADRDSSLWIGTANGLIHVVPGKPWIHYTTADGLPNNEIHYATRDRDGTLWIGTVGGLARLDGNRFRSWTTKDGLSHNAVRAIYQDADGVWWVGTYGGGLSRFDGTRFVTISSREGLFDDIVSSIHEDALGNLWMAGNRGVFRANRRALNAFAAGEMPFVPSPGYGPSDGLLTVETNGGFEPSSWQDADGRLWFATVRGLATVDPREAVSPVKPPSVVIEAMRVDGRTVPLDPGLRVPEGSRAFEFDYTGLTAAAPTQVVFRYRLESVDRDWQYVGGRRTAYFSRMAPGRYTFVVTAANTDGVWNPAEQRLSFVVPAVWYATLWFRALILIAIVATVAFMVRQRLERLHERARLQREFARQLISAQEAERGRIAGELHDSLSQDLLVMKSRAAIALGAVDAHHAVRPHIEEIVEVATQASRNAREISHNLRPHQLDHLGLTAALRDLAARTSAACGIEISVEAEDADRLFRADESIHIYRITQEALNNVLKHAEARHVSIHLGSRGRDAALSITDDGRGFELSRGLGFGLNGIGQRVQLVGGRMNIRSAPGAGTAIEIVLPVRG